jgi:NAD(P)-dependent dehydrogenase (short-subunit alcohol dehydrogenase family)
MVNLLDKQTVVVIGGTSGIGFEVAKHVLETTKANVLVASSKEERVQKAVSSLKSLGKDRVRGYGLDVSDSANLEKAVTEFYEKIGTINHLIYTAGEPGFEFMTMEQHEQARAQKIFKIRYWSMLECVKTQVEDASIT